MLAAADNALPFCRQGRRVILIMLDLSADKGVGFSRRPVAPREGPPEVPAERVWKPRRAECADAPKGVPAFRFSAFVPSETEADAEVRRQLVQAAAKAPRHHVP